MTFALNTPLAEALNNRIQHRLVEIGWASGDDNSPLGEYICLMIVNGKGREQIASELSGDLLGLSPDDDSAVHFASWLFDTLEALRNEMNGGEAQTSEKSMETSEDHEMGDAGEDGVPTAPKAMRQPNTRRLMNHINKAMERRPDDVLHRVRAQPTERIDKFRRDIPRGPARQNGPPHSNGVGRMNNNRHQPNRMGGRPYGPNGMIGNVSSQQQMAFYQMYQQQAQMMAPFTNGPGAPAPGFPGPNMRGPPHHHHHHHNNRNMPAARAPMDDAYSNNLSQPQPHQQQHRMGGNVRGPNSLFERIQNPSDASQDGSVEKSEEDQKKEKLDEVPCKFGTGCTKPECPFGHPSPAQLVLGGKPVHYVAGEKCPFGIGCKNRKCAGSHPSPASSPAFHARPKQIDQDCKFFPNCTNPTCPFKHPAMPMCRNGANCTRPDCHFTHTETACKFKPCLNPNCIYKHEEGQQQAPAPGENPFGNKVWTAPGKGRGEHVSERKFVHTDDTMEEELIIPGAADNGDVAPLDVE